ncbi:MAG TPA: SH3 domain-containing protein [Anaerolineaceae bacterium]|nr:SH3 domain-containing protein [Anaerolineaceae bacterium]
MRASLGDESARVWQEPNSESISLTSIHKGEEFEIGKVIRKKKEVWVTITLDNGVTGFISGDTHIFAIQQVEAVGNDLELYQQPDSSSPVLATIAKKTLFTVHGVETVNEESWYRAETEEGVQGYIKSGSRLRAKPQVTKESARKMMITGALFAVGGAVLYFLFPSNPEAAGGNTSFISLGLILLGLFQVFQGFAQYRQQSKKD